MIVLRNEQDTADICNLKPASCICSKELNGAWTVSLAMQKKGNAAELLNRRILEVPTPSGIQKFRILICDNTDESRTDVTAFHISYDLKGNYVKDTFIQNKNRVDACKQILANTLRATKFTVVGTGNTLNNLRIVGYNPFFAICGTGDDNTVTNRYGGEVDFDNYKIKIYDYTGEDNQYLIAWNKNMTALNESIDETELCTQIIPIGRDRLMLPELTVDSLYINSYENIYTKELDCPDIGPQEASEDSPEITEAQALEMLRERVKKHFRESKCDIAKASYNVTMKDIKHNPTYKNLKFFYKLNAGDYVTILKKNNLKLKSRVRAYEYDCLKEELLSVTINSTENKMSGNIGSMNDKLDSILNGNNKVKSEKLEGIIDLLTVSMGAMVDSAEKHRSKAILFEDKVAASKTFGAMAIGTKGFMIASKWDPKKDDWDWRTFGTGQGFVADCIVGGILQGCILKSLEGDMEINLDRNNDGMVFYLAGKKTFQINKNAITFFDQDTGNIATGRIASVIVGNATVKGLSMNHTTDSYMSLSYSDKGSPDTYTAYGLFDLYNKHPNSTKPISWWQDMDLVNGKKLWFTDGYIYRASSGAMDQICPKGWSISRSESNPMLQIPSGLNEIIAYIPIRSTANFSARSLSTDTPTAFGLVSNPTAESTQGFIEDIGEATIDSTGIVVISLDLVFQEQIEDKYHIFTSIYEGSITKITRDINCFTVLGAPGTVFSYQIKAKKKVVI
ncbi:MAG: phage tail spike protein [Filifactoraceae bacterium]